MKANGISTGTPRSADGFSRAIVYAHLSGVGAFWLASYLDGTPAVPSLRPYVSQLALLLGLLTFILCPPLVLWLSTTNRLTGRSAAAALALTCSIEALRVLAMLPLVQ